MKVLTAQQLKEADLYTIEHEPVAAIDLMERAAQTCVDWLLRHKISTPEIHIFCGGGGNGGDGLAIARLLHGYIETSSAQVLKNISVYILQSGKKGTAEFETNRARLNGLAVSIKYIESENEFPHFSEDDLVIDALYGFGLARPLEGMSAALVNHLNSSRAEIVSVDLPSGLFADQSSLNNTIICARHTLTFECYKPGLLIAENAPFVGNVHVRPIGLHTSFLQSLKTDFETTDPGFINQIFRPRNRFAHKGNFGHALLVGGSYGKIGAIVLATSSCLRSGAGLVTAYLPECGYPILQTAVPEAMTITDPANIFLSQPPPDLDRFSAIGIGPGMGLEKATTAVLQSIIESYKKPMVLDADALNALAQEPELQAKLFQNTILTPHPKEFERLFGKSANGFEQIALARKKATELDVIIILKGHHSLVALPDGRAYFNTTGNAGMAKGGSGDALTGILTALLAQGYAPADAAVLGVYLHGLAGDFAAKKSSKEAMTIRDLIFHLSDAFLLLNKSNA